jgi:hypothetical protein
VECGGSVTGVESVQATLTSGQVVSAALTVSPKYPYPVQTYASVAKAGDTVQAGAARIGSTQTILDFQNVPQTLGDLTVDEWATGGYSVFVPAASYLNVNWDLPASALSAATQTAIKAITTGTNNFEILRLGGIPSTQPVFLSGKITAEPPAGVILNGVQLYEGVSGGTIGPLTMIGFPGSSSVPPGETFMLGAWHVGGTWYFVDVELDGRVNGVAASASNFGHNYLAAGAVLNYTGLYSHHVKYGAGITHYECGGGVTFNHYGSRFDQVAGASINVEQCGGSTWNLHNVSFGVATEDLILDTTSGFMTVNIYDPVFTDGRTDGKVHITCHKTYGYGLPAAAANTQLTSTGALQGVNLYVGGVLRNDLIALTVK